MTQDNTGKPATRNTNIRGRGWAVTLNNPTEEDENNFMLMKKCSFIYQIESGTNGTPHLQGFLYFENAVSFASVKKKLPKAHIELAKNKQASINYCQKPETRVRGPYTNGGGWLKTDKPADQNPDEVLRTIIRNAYENVLDERSFNRIDIDSEQLAHLEGRCLKSCQICKQLDNFTKRFGKAYFEEESAP